MLNALRAPGAGLSITGSSATVSAGKDEKELSAASSGEGIAPRRCTQHLLLPGHSPLRFFLVYLVQLWVYLCGVAREEWGGPLLGTGTYPWSVLPVQSLSVMQLKPVFLPLHFTYPQHTPIISAFSQALA